MKTFIFGIVFMCLVSNVFAAYIQVPYYDIAKELVASINSKFSIPVIPYDENTHSFNESVKISLWANPEVIPTRNVSGNIVYFVELPPDIYGNLYFAEFNERLVVYAKKRAEEKESNIFINIFVGLINLIPFVEI